MRPPLRLREHSDGAGDLSLHCAELAHQECRGAHPIAARSGDERRASFSRDRPAVLAPGPPHRTADATVLHEWKESRSPPQEHGQRLLLTDNLGQRRTLRQHGPSGRRAVAGAASRSPWQATECRLSASRLGTVAAVEAIVGRDDRHASNVATRGGWPLLLPDLRGSRAAGGRFPFRGGSDAAGSRGRCVCPERERTRDAPDVRNSGGGTLASSSRLPGPGPLHRSRDRRVRRLRSGECARGRGHTAEPLGCRSRSPGSGWGANGRLARPWLPNAPVRCLSNRDLRTDRLRQASNWIRRGKSQLSPVSRMACGPVS